MSVTLAAAASLAAAQPAAAPAPDYASGKDWLCLPDRRDVCSMSVTAHRLTRDGWDGTETSSPNKQAPIDCFYVYPTISRDSGMNADLNPGNGEEKYVAQYQFARFSSVCRPFAPVYRQMTMSSIALALTGADMTGYGELAFEDVRAAFRDYMANRNEGRPFVLIGHSQGSIMLEQLVREEIEGSRAHDLMLRAILPGWNIMVPEGETVGGSFRETPVCTAPTQTGCVMSWATYGAGQAPPTTALFGYSAVPGMQPVCTLPDGSGLDGWRNMDGFFIANSKYPVKGGPIRWSRRGAPPGQYAVGEDFAQARCVRNGPRAYLEVRLPRDARDTRTGRIGGDVGMSGIFLPGWGKHLLDLQIAQDDLIALVGRLGEQAGRRD